jgi:hypothetical protein
MKQQQKEINYEIIQQLLIHRFLISNNFSKKQGRGRGRRQRNEEKAKKREERDAEQQAMTTPCLCLIATAPRWQFFF